MYRELDKRDFFKIKRGYDNALDMYEQGYYKEALLELRPGLTAMEKDAMQTRMLAKYRLLQGKAHQALHQNRQAENSYLSALETLRIIQDHSALTEEVQDLLLQVS